MTKFILSIVFVVAINLYLISCFSIPEGGLTNMQQYNKVSMVQTWDLPISINSYNNGLIVLSHYEDEDNVPNKYLLVRYNNELKTTDSLLIPKPEYDNFAAMSVRNDKLLIFSRTKEDNSSIVNINAIVYDLSSKKTVRTENLYNVDFDKNKDIDGELNALIRFSPDSSHFMIFTKTHDLKDNGYFIGKVYNTDLKLINQFEHKIQYPEEEEDYTLEIVIDNSGNSYIVSAMLGKDNEDNSVRVDRISNSGVISNKIVKFKKEIRAKGEDSFIDKNAAVKFKSDNTLAILISHNIGSDDRVALSYIELDFLNDNIKLSKTNVLSEETINQMIDRYTLDSYKIVDFYYTPAGNIVTVMCHHIIGKKRTEDKAIASQIRTEDQMQSMRNPQGMSTPNMGLESQRYKYSDADYFNDNLYFYFDSEFNLKWKTALISKPMICDTTIFLKLDMWKNFVSHNSEWNYFDNLPGYNYKSLNWGWLPDVFPVMHYEKDVLYFYGIHHLETFGGLYRIGIDEKTGSIISKDHITIAGPGSVDLKTMNVRGIKSFSLYILGGFLDVR